MASWPSLSWSRFEHAEAHIRFASSHTPVPHGASPITQPRASLPLSSGLQISCPLQKTPSPQSAAFSQAGCTTLWSVAASGVVSPQPATVATVATRPTKTHTEESRERGRVGDIESAEYIYTETLYPHMG